MNGQRIGYVRVSTADQNTARQLEGVQVDRVFEDKASGKDTSRPQLEALLAFAREGDTVLVHSFDRLARNARDLHNLIHDMTARGIKVQFMKENLIFGGTGNAHAELLLGIMASVSQFERASILERQREGIAKAKDRGAYKGRKPSLTEDQAAALREQAALGVPKAKLARDFGISRETVYQYLAAEA